MTFRDAPVKTFTFPPADADIRAARAVVRGGMARYKHPAQKVTRDQMRELGRCINGPRDLDIDPQTPSKSGIVHGPVVSGGKCQRCIDVHRKGSTR
jgi:hypothetical protein